MAPLPSEALQLRAHFQAVRRRAAQRLIDDPPPEALREGHAAGNWPGNPYNDLPPLCPVLPLGVSDGVLYVADATGELKSIPSKDWTKNKAIEIFGPYPNYMHWAWPRKVMQDKGGVRPNGVDVSNLFQCLYAAASRSGAGFDPAQRVRGRGGWATEGGHLIWHGGDRLFTVERGRLIESQPGELGRHFYVRRPGVIEPFALYEGDKEDRAGTERVLDPAAPGSRIAELLDTLRAWHWQRDYLDPLLVLGFLGVALAGAALSFRPHLFLVADHGRGKSTLQNLMRAVLGPVLFAAGNATAAGIYQPMKHDSLPVSVDEMEADGGQRIRDVVALAQVASSGDQIARGGADHQGTQFQARSAYVLSAINPPPMDAAKKSRFAFLNMAALDVGAREPRLDRAQEIGPILLRRLMQEWERFEEVLDGWKEAMSVEGLDQRSRATYGTLLAMAETLAGPAAIERVSTFAVSDRGAWGQLLAEATATERADREANWEACLSHLLGSPILEWTEGGVKPSIGEVVEKLLTGAYQIDEARRRLGSAGLGMRTPGPNHGYLLAVPHRHPQLTKIFAAERRWADGVWTSALRQGPPEIIVTLEKGKHTVRIGVKTSHCTLVDVTRLRDMEERR